MRVDFTELINGYGVSEIRDWARQIIKFALETSIVEVGSVGGLTYWLTDSGAVYVGGSLLKVEDTGYASQRYFQGDYFANEFNYPCRAKFDIEEGDELIQGENYEIVEIEYKSGGGTSEQDANWEVVPYTDIDGNDVNVLFQILEDPEPEPTDEVEPEEPEGSEGSEGPEEENESGG